MVATAVQPVPVSLVSVTSTVYSPASTPVRLSVMAEALDPEAMMLAASTAEPVYH